MPQKFEARDWQDRFVRDYQTNPKKNFLLEGCVSAGKTGGALNCYVSLKDNLDWRFLAVVVSSEHLKKQYAQDAFDFFGLNLFYSGTVKSIGRLPTPEELLKQGYQGIVISYQWLTKSGNAEWLKNALSANITLAGKTFLILDEVHHASSDLAFGQACEIAFPDNVVSHRLMTSGTPFRSDNNKILGNWVNYVSVEENIYECLPDFRYTLADALIDEIIPVFSFVTMAGEFTYRRGRYEYTGKTFTNATSEQELTDALNTAIYVDGDWVKEAILWAHKRMQRDRLKEFPECATYVRVSSINAAWKMKERIRRLTGEEALVVVSRDDDPGASNSSLSKQDPSTLIEEFRHETGRNARAWIIAVNILGEGVSIKRLKYRIHATNVRAILSFMQDLGRLLRPFPSISPEPVETLIPAHPELIDLALSAMNEVAHVIREKTQEQEEERGDLTNDEETDSEPILSFFEPLASTGELSSQIVDGEEILEEYTNVAEWAVANKEFWQSWGKTPAHLAQMLQKEKPIFEILRQEYQKTVGEAINIQNIKLTDVPAGFPSEYASFLPDKKLNFVRKAANKKAYQLACILFGKIDEKDRKEKLKEIHTKAKRRNKLPLDGFISHEGWEKIYLWLCDRIAQAQDIKEMEDL